MGKREMCAQLCVQTEGSGQGICICVVILLLFFVRKGYNISGVARSIVTVFWLGVSGLLGICGQKFFLAPYKSFVPSLFNAIQYTFIPIYILLLRTIYCQ